MGFCPLINWENIGEGKYPVKERDLALDSEVVKRIEKYLQSFYLRQRDSANYNSNISRFMSLQVAMA